MTESSSQGEEERPPENVMDEAAAVNDGNDEEENGETVVKRIEKGSTAIEQIAEKIRIRREQRIGITAHIRLEFVKSCYQVAKQEGRRNKIVVAELVDLKEKCKRRIELRTQRSQMYLRVSKFVGIWDVDRELLNLYELGIQQARAVASEWFYFRDFAFYYTKLVPRQQILGTGTAAALKWLFLFYLFSAILFCAIMDDSQVCPRGDQPYEGWMTSLYFASVTLSTVGYGDVSIDPDNTTRGRVFIGSAYMVVAARVGYTVFAAAAEQALSGLTVSPLGDWFANLFEKYHPTNASLTLDQQIRRIRFLRITELVVLFLLYNFVGVVIARAFINNSDEEGEDWTWMTTFYWAIQTTTTIGYGDLNMPFDMRWFQIFYTIIGTALVGSVFGGISSLSQELQDLRRYFAWRRREVSRRMVNDMQGGGAHADAKIDQYEFFVASLLELNKVAMDDVNQIMDKFRELDGPKVRFCLSNTQFKTSKSAVLKLYTQGYITFQNEDGDSSLDLRVESARREDSCNNAGVLMNVDDDKQSY